MTTTTEPALEAATLAEGGWQRAYVEWRAAHGDELWAVSCAVPDVATLQLIHGLIESAIRTGWQARVEREAVELRELAEHTSTLCALVFGDMDDPQDPERHEAILDAASEAWSVLVERSYPDAIPSGANAGDQ